MIVTSAALVVMAIAMLIWGIVAEQLTAVYASVGLSVVSAVLLLVGVFLRRRELFGDAARRRAAMAPQGAAVGTAGLGKTAVPVGGAPHGATRDTAGGMGGGTMPADRAPAPRPAGSPAPGDDGETYPVPTGLDVPGDALVHVVPGRRRYHLGSCRQLKGRESEELTYEEAHEEGFSACTACMPDTALAARAAHPPRPRRTTLEPPAITPANSTWDGQSVEPGGGEPAGIGDIAETGTEDGEASTGADAGGAGEGTGDGGTEDTNAEPVQVVQGTKRYHRPECALVNAVPEDEITSMALARAMEEGYGPCLACEPDKAAAR